MSVLLKWFQTEVHGWKWCTFLLLSVSVAFTLATLDASLFALADIEPSSVYTVDQSVYPAAVALYHIPTSALLEELEFRVPLFVVGLLSIRLVPLAFLASVIVFGCVHGDITNILLQGVVGLVLGVVFLKCGGLQKKPFKALASSTVVHALYNGLIWI